MSIKFYGNGISLFICFYFGAVSGRKMCPPIIATRKRRVRTNSLVFNAFVRRVYVYVFGHWLVRMENVVKRQTRRSVRYGQVLVGRKRPSLRTTVFIEKHYLSKNGFMRIPVKRHKNTSYRFDRTCNYAFSAVKSLSFISGWESSSSVRTDEWNSALKSIRRHIQVFQREQRVNGGQMCT